MPPPSVFFTNSDSNEIKHPSLFSALCPPAPNPSSMARQPVTVGRHFNLVTLPQVGANYHFKRMGLLRSVPVARSPPSSAASPNCLAMLIRAPGPSLNSRVPPYWTKLFAAEKRAPSLVIPYKQGYVLICVKTAQSDGNAIEGTFQSLFEGGLWEKCDFDVSGRLHVFFSQSSRLNQPLTERQITTPVVSKRFAQSKEKTNRSFQGKCEATVSAYMQSLIGLSL